MQPTGAYTAERASALSGVPMSTIHYWSREAVLAPSVSAERVKLWSYSDLIGLRIIYWLRREKTDAAGAAIPRTGMKSIRRALARLRELDEPMGRADETPLWIDRAGRLYVRGRSGPETVAGQTIMTGAVNLIAPFQTREGLRGPDLARPRSDLRIAPGRLSGAPHIIHTRLETRALSALARDGLDPDAIGNLYPYVTAEQIVQALELERQLEENLRVAA